MRADWTEQPAVFIVAPPVERTPEAQAQDSARKKLQHWVQNQGWPEATVKRTVGWQVGPGRPMQVLKGRDAHELYQLIHRRPTAVVQIGEPRVLLKPREDPSEYNVVSLTRFIRYKALLCPMGRVRDRFDPAALMAGFDTWMQARACDDGDRDARSLPLHVMSPDREWDNLDGAAGVREFERRHGRAMTRVDHEGRRWQSPNALHGRETLIVAGVTLRTGFHWDVVSDRGSGSMSTCTEVWGFTPGAYCNVYPDGAVRMGSRNGKPAKKVFPDPRKGGLNSRNGRDQADRRRSHKR